MTFRECFLQQFEDCTMIYRAQLRRNVEAFKLYCEGGIIDDEAIEIGVWSLQYIKPDQYTRWTGPVTDDDREWFLRTQPDWEKIRKEYEEEIKKLKT